MRCAVPGAEARCFDGRCKIIHCAGGLGDCDQRFDNGCEAVLCYDSHAGWSCGPCGSGGYGYDF